MTRNVGSWLFPVAVGVVVLAASASAFLRSSVIELSYKKINRNIQKISRGGSFFAKNSSISCENRAVRVIGLIGGIASGKSTVAQLLHEHGAVVINADRLGHEAYASGSPGFAAIVEEFGDQVLDKTGTLIDRQRLRKLIFSSPDTEPANSSERPRDRAAQNKEKLESIIWPIIRTDIEDRIQSTIHQTSTEDQEPVNSSCSPKAPGVVVVVVEAALLLEAGWADLCDEVWNVKIDHAKAVERLLDRDPYLKDEDVEGRLRASTAFSREQGGDQRRQLLGSCVLRELENSGGLDDLASQVDAAWSAAIAAAALRHF